MNKILRYSLLMLLAVVANVSLMAADPYKVLTFPDEGTEGASISAYNKSYTATIGSDSWTIAGFNTNKNEWKYIRCGSSKFASVATIVNTAAYDKAIGDVVVTIDKVTAASVNSIKLIVASDADFANVVEEVAATKIETGDMDFKTTKATANLFYKLEFDCAKGSANGLVQVSKVAYYKEGDAPTKVDISNTPETAYTVAEAKKLIDAGEGLATSVYVKGIVSGVKGYNDTYGSITYFISADGTTDNEMTVYGGLSYKGEKFTSKEDIQKGDEVVVYGQLTLYNSTYEVNMNNQLYSLTRNTSGINGIQAEAADGVAYNLAGQKVSADYKGVVIKNGKKMIQK